VQVLNWTQYINTINTLEGFSSQKCQNYPLTILTLCITSRQPQAGAVGLESLMDLLNMKT
jgi:hypothetical protein